jgi:hypothetical protein
VLAVWTEGRVIHSLGMSFQGMKHLASVDSPQAGGFILRCSDNALAVWTEGRVINICGMSFQGMKHLASVDSPQAGGFIP